MDRRTPNTGEKENTEITLREYQTRQQRCYENKIKHGFNTTNFSTEVRYILGEICEVMAALEHKDYDNLAEELSDVVIFCYGLAAMAGKDLDAKIFEKMAINERRIYIQGEDGEYHKIIRAANDQ